MESVRDRRCYNIDFKDGGRGHEPRTIGSATVVAGKGKETEKVRK